MKLFTFTIDEIEDFLRKNNVDPEMFNKTCGGCNWEYSRFFILANSKEQAEKLILETIQDGGNFLCGTCMAEFISEEGYEVVKKS